jgi:hypothetical protein
VGNVNSSLPPDPQELCHSVCLAQTVHPSVRDLHASTRLMKPHEDPISRDGNAGLALRTKGRATAFQVHPHSDCEAAPHTNTHCITPASGQRQFLAQASPSTAPRQSFRENRGQFRGSEFCAHWWVVLVARHGRATSIKRLECGEPPMC